MLFCIALHLSLFVSKGRVGGNSSFLSTRSTFSVCCPNDWKAVFASSVPAERDVCRVIGQRGGAAGGIQDHGGWGCAISEVF